jgi:hypothetical protein
MEETMTKVTQDDLGAVVSRIDAQTVVMIELLAELAGKDPEEYRVKYAKRYDKFAAKFRRNLVK